MRYFLYILLILNILMPSYSYSQEQPKEQPEGTFLTPWVKGSLKYIDVPLKSSISLISDEGFSITHISSNKIVYALNATRPPSDERVFAKMKIRDSFTVSFHSCELAPEETYAEMLDKTIKQISLRIKMSDTNKLSESIRELVLYTNNLTNMEGKVSTFAVEESKGTFFSWETSEKRLYRIVVWESDISENWITFHIISLINCPESL
jgi:hypothetical protein